MFDALIVQPIFNFLVFLYAIIPGHDFGVAIIVFTILIRILLWPIVKKQLHHAKAMRELQPEIKKIKQATKGNRQKESQMMMELYKERQVNPFSTIGLTLLQLPILIGLFFSIRRLIEDPAQIVSFSYSFVRDLSWIQSISQNIDLFDASLFGAIDLKTAAFSGGEWYIPALMLVAASAIMQYFQSKQLMPTSQDGKGLRQILREASSGKKADQTEVQAATSRFTVMFIPLIIFFVTLGFPAALPLYWLTSSLVAFLQQSYILKQDQKEMSAVATTKQKDNVIEGEVVESKSSQKTKTKPKSKAKKTSPKKSKKKRR